MGIHLHVHAPSWSCDAVRLRTCAHEQRLAEGSVEGNVKPIPSYMSFRQALINGYVQRMESRAYLNWVKSLRCVSCDAPADDPHHPHGVGYKGMGTKVPDFWAIPVCRSCHDELHHDVHAWEERCGSQLEHASITLLQAIYEERLKLV